jgi:hypothetical protein
MMETEPPMSGMEGPFFYFPAPPPRVRTRFEIVFAPIRWLIAAAIFLPLLSLFWWSRWLWTRQGIADLRRWAFEKRVSEAERDAFIHEENRRMDAAGASLSAAESRTE